MKQTAAIYDRWLFTLGGGEQVAFAYAQTLRDMGYRTTLLTHQLVDLEKAQQKMDVDLKNIEIRYLPPLRSKEISAYTQEYDLFINTSYLDYFPSRAKKSILSVFFPGKIQLTPVQYIKTALVLPSLKSFFIYPTRFENFNYDELIEGKIHKWLRNSSSIIFNQNIKKFEISLFIETFSFALGDEIKFFLDEKEIYPSGRVLNHHANVLTFYFDTPLTKNKKFTLQLPKEPVTRVALVKLRIPSFRYMLYNLFKKFFPVWEMRLHGGPELTKRSELQTYDKIITISEFCKKWIHRYWLLNSEILYPPVNTDKFKPAANKKNYIIHIGRFFITGHNKKQLDLVKVFKKLVDEQGIKDWELHFIGSIHNGEEHEKYFNQVQQEAQGYPIHFHIDAPFSQLKKLLGEAKIYWHATGLDEDEEKKPILFEHFGVTTVEAMSAGCVPVVIAAGGQKEIVTPESGLLWKTRKELTEKTANLIKDSQLMKQLSKGAIARSKYFSRENFQKRFKKLLDL